MITLDPRTKLLLLLLVGLFVIGYIGGEDMIYWRIALTILPVLLTLSQGKIGRALSFTAIYLVCFFLQLFLLPYTKGVASHLLLLTTGFFIRIMPGALMAMYAFTTTTISEFIAGMKKLHITDKIVIPMSVMFRFFPTCSEEFHAINEAMKMRDIKLGGKKVGKMLEYRLIPMMSCSVLIGEELSASALTRGLGGKKKRTNICTLHLNIVDYILLLFSSTLIIYYIYITIRG